MMPLTGSQKPPVLVKRSRGRKLGKMQRLLDYQSELCRSCGLPPTRLMVERRIKRRKKVETVRKRRKIGQLEAGEEEDIHLSSTPSKWPGNRRVGLELGLWNGMEEEKTLEPDAGLGCQEGEEEWRRGREVREPSLLPIFNESVTASRVQSPRTLRQAHVGDLIEGGLPGKGPEVTWLDQWTGQVWARPIGSVFFCSSCQLTGGVWRV